MSTIKMGNVGATAIATPPPGQVTIFINASNADHVSAKDSNGTVYDLTLGSGGSGLTAGNGITLGTGNTIDLGGALTQPITIISGSSTELLDIGANFPGAHLSQARINATSYQGNHLTAYDGTGAGTLININPGEFSSVNNINPASRTQIINGSSFASLYFTSNKIFRLYLDSSGAGIAPGSGESFTINGTTFTEGIDFTGQGNYLLDAASIAGLNYTGIANFVSVTDEGSGFVKFIFSNPVQVSETLTDGNFLVFNWESSVQTNNDGVQLEVRDVYGIPYTTLLMGDSETIFTDNSTSPKGIQYNGFGEIDETGATADYSSLVGISLVPKVWVEGQLGSKVSGSGILNYSAIWTPDGSTLGTGIIQDDGTTIGIGQAPNGATLIGMKSALDATMVIDNTSTIAFSSGINVSAFGAASTKIGAKISASQGTDSNVGISVNTSGVGHSGDAGYDIGIFAQAGSTTRNNIAGWFSSGQPSGSENIAIRGTASLGSTNYAIQLQDGTEGIGKFLKNVAADGKANWADIYEQITVTNTTHNVGTERTIFADSSSNSITINLPAASTNAGKMLTVKKINAANTVTLDGNGSENIDGAATYAMTTNYDKVTVQCNGTQWFIIA